MIAFERITEAERLLATGLSYREISKLTGVGRTTIGQIAKGTRELRDRETIIDGPNICSRELETPRRCSGCGGLVYMPCWLCAMRELLAMRGPVEPAREVVDEADDQDEGDGESVPATVTDYALAAISRKWQKFLDIELPKQ